jgi:acetate kinase
MAHRLKFCRLAEEHVNVLVLNCGTSSVKFQVTAVDPQRIDLDGHHGLARGSVGPIGGDAVLQVDHPGRPVEPRPVWPSTHEAAARRIIEWCRDTGLFFDAVGHRLLHGGERFTRPTLIDESVIASLEVLEDLSPLHCAPGLAGVRAARASLNSDTPMVAVFDTAFHLTMPERACLYALPRDLARRLGLRRFGSHGLSYRWLVRRYAQIAGIPESRATFVAFHLGEACSAAAIAGGKSIDTSAGLTPQDGLVMGTRCGDVDASVLTYLERAQGLAPEEIERLLNEESGLKGLSGLGHDLRDLVGRAREHPGARLAVEAFCYRARKYLGAYIAALGGADAVIFSGGIGEYLPTVRARICDGMEWCGLEIDPEANRRAIGGEAEIGARGTRMRAFVIPTDEEAVIARETAACLLHTVRQVRTPLSSAR